MKKELDIEQLTLANAAGGCLEEQFQDYVKDVLDVHQNADDFETSKGALKFEITAKVKIEIDPKEGTTWIEGQVTGKGPKRKSRRQVGRLADGQVLVDCVPLPVQQTVKFPTSILGN